MRVLVVGAPGSGKTTVARRLARTLGLAHIELDALHWEPGWTEAEPEVLRERVRQAMDPGAWVVDGSYTGKLGRLVWDAADVVVWLDPPRWRSTRQVVTRTLRRVLLRQELWNGNREGMDSLAFWRGQDSVLWWAWHGVARNRERYASAADDPRNAHLEIVRLRTKGEVDALVRRLAEGRPAAQPQERVDRTRR